MKRRVRQQLAQDRKPSRQVRARALVRREDGGRLVLTLTLRGDGLDSERRLPDASCNDLADAAALLIALALDPERASPVSAADTGASTAGAATPSHRQGTGDEGEDPGENEAAGDTAEPKGQTSREAEVTAPPPRRAAPETPVTRRDEPEDGLETPPPSTPSSPTRWGLDVGLTASGEAGMLPHAPAFSFRPRIALGLDALRLIVAGRLVFPDEHAIDAHPGGRVEARALIGSLAVCYAHARPAWELSPCVFGDLGVVDAETRGVTSPSSGHVPWASAGGGLSFGHRLAGRFWVVADATLSVPVRAPRLLLQGPAGDEDIYQSGPLVGSVALGVIYRFL